MTRNMPLRLTTLHFEQRFLIDDVTFMITSPVALRLSLFSRQSFDYTCFHIFRPQLWNG
jgi:hypothetical protein